MPRQHSIMPSADLLWLWDALFPGGGCFVLFILSSKLRIIWLLSYCQRRLSFGLPICGRLKLWLEALVFPILPIVRHCSTKLEYSTHSCVSSLRRRSNLDAGEKALVHLALTHKKARPKHFEHAKRCLRTDEMPEHCLDFQTCKMTS